MVSCHRKSSDALASDSRHSRQCESRKSLNLRSMWQKARACQRRPRPDPAGGLRKPAVDAVVPVIAHHELRPCGNRELGRVVRMAVAQVQNRMGRVARQRLDVAPLPADFADPGRAVRADRQAARPALRLPSLPEMPDRLIPTRSPSMCSTPPCIRILSPGRPTIRLTQGTPERGCANTTMLPRAGGLANTRPTKEHSDQGQEYRE